MAVSEVGSVSSVSSKLVLDQESFVAESALDHVRLGSSQSLRFRPQLGFGGQDNQAPGKSSCASVPMLRHFVFFKIPRLHHHLVWHIDYI